jgi:hypothetical protein
MVDYLLADEAIADKKVEVTEVSEAGSVPALLVNNPTDVPVLFLEGEELRGAKQDRVLNTSVLIAAASKAMIPVSCVEPRRWRRMSRFFGSGGGYASSKLRHVLKRSVNLSAQQGQGHGSDQTEVWKEVGRQMTSLGSSSPTGAMADTYSAHRENLAEFRARLQYVEGAIGLAVTVGVKVVSVDLFDKPITCCKVWPRLLTGLVMDALESGTETECPSVDNVCEMLVALRNASWRPTPAAGAGEEFHSDWTGDHHASALTCGGTLLHGSLIASRSQ